MRYRIKGQPVDNGAIIGLHINPMVNQVRTMMDQLNAMTGRINTMMHQNILPDTSGECDGSIVEDRDFERVHKMVTETAAHVSSLYNQTIRRIDREVARTQMQILDGTI